MSEINNHDDNQNDNHEIVYNLDLFVSDDLKQCLNIVKELSSLSTESDSTERKIEKLCERFDVLINKWQINPKLIETHLTELLSPIIEIVANSVPNSGKFNASFNLIQRLVSCIGPKSVCRYFSTETLWLKKLIDWTEKQDPNDSHSWQTRSVLLLWLSMSVKTPFNLKKFDSSDEIPVSQRIYGLIEKYLKVTDKSYDSAAFLSANFLSRPDVIEQEFLNRFMSEKYSKLNTHFGYVKAMALLFKVVNRLDIIPFAERVIEVTTKLDICGHELMAKWKIKLIGRSALSLMTPRLAKWRYRRGRRLLSQNLTLKTTDPNETQLKQQNESVNDIEDDCDYSDIPDQIELIIDSLLSGLDDSNTIVRWSAAKYLSRITNRLPKELAADVVTHVLELCESKVSDSSWHGSCLALAELARRGLILVNQLPQIVSVVGKALVFDQIKGTFSVGANVRDAACFVCWSVSRAYESQEILEFVRHLAPIMICVTCFDREVNCRRAASAAIQEMVGRTQVFPHGMEVLLLTDFHLLANRNHCYLDIAYNLAQKPEFGKTLFEYLLQKCNHWDRDIRDIVGQALGKLSTIIDVNPYFDDLLTKSTSLNLNSRHGSIQSIGYIIESNGNKLNPEFKDKIESIAELLFEKKFLKGIGGEFMKQAFCLLIWKCSSVEFPISSKVFDVWIEILCESITSEDLKTRTDAIRAVPLFCKTYLENEPTLKEHILNQLLKHLGSSKESSRIGSSESVRLMSRHLLNEEFYKQYFDIIVNHINSGDQLCNSRASEVLSLVELSLKFTPIETNRRTTILESLCVALDDRTMDARGDIGGNVRLAAIEASSLFVHLLDDNELIKILKLMSTQCVSFWLKERKAAIIGFKQIIFNRDSELISGEIKTILEDMTEDNEWKTFIRLLKFDLFTYDLWRGLVKCVSNPTETLVRNLLKHELNANQSQIFDQFLVLYENNLTNESLSQNCINCCHFLLSSCRTTEDFKKKVLTLTWNSIRRSKDCRKIISAIDVFCVGLQLSTYKHSLSYLTILLCHSWPRIRCQTANQTYVALLTADDINEDVINLLSDTDWSQPLTKLKPIRDSICDALGVPKPKKLNQSSN